MNKDSRTAAGFPETRWSIVQRARGEDRVAHAALDDLCRLYWRPVYAFVRRRGNPPAAAEDLTQSFFADLLRRGSLGAAEQEKGRMRTFLLTAVSRHMANEHERATAQRRGGGAPHLSLDVAGAEAALGAAPAQGVTPEIEFDRQWCLQLLDARGCDASSQIVSAAPSPRETHKHADCGEGDRSHYKKNIPAAQPHGGNSEDGE